MLLPNLDDRRWADLVDEGRALIPRYAPEWTDHNVHDPGITLMELFASVTEMDIFQLNRISDRARLKFLSLIGIHPEPPQPATTVLSFSLRAGASIQLPAGLELAGADPFGVSTGFHTLAPIDIVSANLVAIQLKDAIGFHDLTDRWRRSLPFGVFGDVPLPGTELYLGFDHALAAGESFSLFAVFGGGRSGMAERHSILAEAAVQENACIPVVPACRGSELTTYSGAGKPKSLPPFYGARISWELLDADGWLPLPARAVIDDTRSFTLDGSVVITPPQDAPLRNLGKVSAPLSYLRVRFEAGAYDAPPILQRLLMNAVQAEQAVAVGSITWNIGPGVVTSPPKPPAEVAGLELQFDAAGNISTLQFLPFGPGPHFRILGFTAATANAAGSLSVELASIGMGDGTPGQRMSLPQTPVKQWSLALISYESGEFRRWRLRFDLDASSRSDRDFLLDATAGVITFGDGERGLAAPAGVLFYASYLSTRADAGNLPPGAIGTMVDSPHNRGILTNFDDVVGRVAVTNPGSAAGGAPAETLGHTTGRAIVFLQEPQRAVTVADYETLAEETPGTQVARVKAWPNLHPSFPCFKAPGMVSVVILPNMPVARPTPSTALRSAVAAYLSRRRILGSRLEVVAPTYREVAVQAQIHPLPGTSKSALRQRVVDTLTRFLNPLTGGPDRAGWPFGRDVFHAEILQVIDEVVGVDFVASLALLADGCPCDPQCVNVCLAPTWLVASGQHLIEVL